MTSALRDYQAECAARAYHTIKEFGGFYVHHDPGMGKTLTAIAIARLLKTHRIAVVCPPIALGVWQREMRKWWKSFPVEDAANEMRCISYDSLSDPVPADPSSKRRASGRTRLKELCDWMPELLILDEAHYVKSPTSNRTKAVWQLRMWATYCVALSGTASHNDLDLWAQYRMIAKDEPLFQQSYTEYKKSIFVLSGPGGSVWPKKDKEGRYVYKAGAPEKIAQAISVFTHVADASLMELPEPVFSVVPFELGKVERVAYNDMEKTLRAELPDGDEADAEIALTKLLRLTQIAAGHVTNTKGGTVHLGYSRTRTTIDLLNERPDQKVVIACRFKEDIRWLIVMLNELGRPVAKIDGGTLPKFRTKYEDWFQSDKSARNAVILLQYQAGGTAITLHASHTLILHTLDYSIIRYRQMLGRIWRLGQKGLCEVLVPVAEDTQDEIMYSGLQSGADHANMAKRLMRYLHR